MKFEELRSKYNNFIYHGFTIDNDSNTLNVIYDFEIEGLSSFNPSFSIPKSIITNDNIDHDILNLLIFNIGMVEAISYYKITCSPKFIVENNNLDEDQKRWWRKLYFLGLGEFLYRNDITIKEDDLLTIDSLASKIIIDPSKFISNGNIIPVGGGKDSCVTLELLSGMNNVPFTINAKEVHKQCIKTAGYDNWYNITRNLDSKMLELNEQGFLNGHTPFSSLVAFYSYLVAYLTNKKYIVLSNESSANESTVLGSFVNHQYSKSFEFERDFNNYVNQYIGLDIHYFSLLRPIKEIKIAELFSKYNKYHYIFKSCNVGSKSLPWKWCGDCPKCLFVFSILSAFLPLDYLSDIFNKNLFQDEKLLDTFKEILGYTKVKPFECVGECDEVKWAISKAIRKNENNLPYLLKYYKENYPLFSMDLLNTYNEDNLIPDDFLGVVKDMMNND